MEIVIAMNVNFNFLSISLLFRFHFHFPPRSLLLLLLFPAIVRDVNPFFIQLPTDHSGQREPRSSTLFDGHEASEQPMKRKKIRKIYWRPRTIVLKFADL